MLLFFFFNDTATTEIYTLSLHDALPISQQEDRQRGPQSRLERAEDQQQTGQRGHRPDQLGPHLRAGQLGVDRKSTRLNSSHANISYAVFCLKKTKPKNLLHFRYASKKTT